MSSLTKTIVIVVNFNGEKVLSRCLESLKHQTFSNFKTIVVDNCANLMQPELEAIVLYPNPNKGSFTVDGLPETGSIFVYTVEGKLVTYHRIEGQTQIINLSRPVPGIYRVQIQTPQGDRIFKMIIS